MIKFRDRVDVREWIDRVAADVFEPWWWDLLRDWAMVLGFLAMMAVLLWVAIHPRASMVAVVVLGVVGVLYGCYERARANDAVRTARGLRRLLEDYRRGLSCQQSDKSE